jgi:hypothetical protein
MKHGWSVSATRTIGNVGSWRDAKESPLTYDKFVRGAELMANQPRGIDYYAGWCGSLTAADIDAVRDVPVMPDEAPLADMAKPDDVFAELAVWAAKEMVAPSPLSPPTLVQLPRDPSPGVCPSCRMQRRERGEVRVHYWKCSCPVRAEFVYQFWAAGDDHGDYYRGGSDEELAMARRNGFELVWRATGHGASASHPTEAGAVSAWREALANAQREEDSK